MGRDVIVLASARGGNAHAYMFVPFDNLGLPSVGVMPAAHELASESLRRCTSAAALQDRGQLRLSRRSCWCAQSGILMSGCHVPRTAVRNISDGVRQLPVLPT